MPLETITWRVEVSAPRPEILAGREGRRPQSPRRGAEGEEGDLPPREGRLRGRPGLRPLPPRPRRGLRRPGRRRRAGIYGDRRPRCPAPRSTRSRNLIVRWEQVSAGASGPDPARGPLEPPGLGRRGAGPGPDADLLHERGARGRRPLGRPLRPPRPDGRPGRHRHPGPRQRDGDERPPLPRSVPGRDPAARRRPRHEPPVADLGPPQRLHRDDARSSAGASSSPSSATAATPSTSAAGASGPTAGRSTRRGSSCPSPASSPAGEPNEELLRLVRANVRTPFEVVGDLYAQAGSNEVGGARLLEMMEEFDLADIESLSDEVCSRSEKRDARGHHRATRRRLRAPDLDRRLRRADRAGRRGARRGGRDRRGLRGLLAPERARHQRRAQLHRRLHHLRSQVRHQPRRAQQRRQLPAHHASRRPRGAS